LLLGLFLNSVSWRQLRARTARRLYRHPGHPDPNPRLIEGQISLPLSM
jgi:hypothetical protein